MKYEDEIRDAEGPSPLNQPSPQAEVNWDDNDFRGNSNDGLRYGCGFALIVLAVAPVPLLVEQLTGRVVFEGVEPTDDWPATLTTTAFALAITLGLWLVYKHHFGCHYSSTPLKVFFVFMFAMMLIASFLGFPESAHGK